MFHPRGPTLAELTRQALSSTKDGYDLLAPKFDFTPFRTPDALVQEALAAIETRPAVECGLDLCCGTGAALRAMRRLCAERAVGIDFSRGMLEVARDSLGEETADSPVALVEGDVLQLPFRSCFDLVTCFGAFGHILRRDEPRFVDGIAGCLRPGGRFVFVTTDRPPLWSPGAWIARTFNGAMRVRNALLHPPFVMYYLTFLLPRARRLLEDRGFRVEVLEGRFPPPWHPLLVVVATLD